MRLFTTTTLLLMLFCTPLLAKDELLTFSFNDAVEYGYAEGILDESIKYYLSGQNHLTVTDNFGEFKSNKKTNAFGKKDKTACDWALLSALKSFQQRTKSLGGNAVINIKSNYKNREFISSELFQCGSGNIMAGVALKGEVVKQQK